ncbi:hypothetical protein G6O69_23495 [Pseudenhygromyxa sp. WMMC2535]|uniref:hypothetical protein n=1 Tax=Pseudenhygromyxa sp. WMMC2535 TaxID=2712867 RepID=UPI001554E0E4|nr:hypothetical protein [Pseudenhygromyxa sp. WMMC2535]NVB40824.1 hypothetical protein [Pseudenhygromyxa sp. WMMC2535]
MKMTLTLPNRIWRDEKCYFAYPMVAEDLELEDFDAWQVLGEAIQAAQNGDFGATPGLLEKFDRDDHWIRRAVYGALLGDAGTDAINERVLELYARGGLSSDYSWGLSIVLYAWGRLDVVPHLVREWRKIYLVDEDAMYIPPRLGCLLEEERGDVHDAFPGPERDDDEAADAYLELVMARCTELQRRYGDRAFLFRGRPIDPAWIAERGLRDLAESPKLFDSHMRQKFEAMTGIDCSSFYEDEKGNFSQRVKPLAAAAIFEEFLASPQRHAFEPGKRYFFGHPIPPGDPEGARQWPPR